MSEDSLGDRTSAPIVQHALARTQTPERGSPPVATTSIFLHDIVIQIRAKIVQQKIGIQPDLVIPHSQVWPMT
jgi:hypothetical protein